jgi:tetratricopeptide (TPR) repeat protein
LTSRARRFAPCDAGRPSAALAAALFVLLALAGRAPGAEAAEHALVLAPRAEARASFLARGATEWARLALTDAGLACDASLVTGVGLEPQRTRVVPDASTLQAIAQRHGGRRGLVLEIRLEPAEATVRLLLVDLERGSLVAAGRAVGPLAGLGESLAEAVRGVAAQASLRAPAVAVPSPGDLDRLGRAIAHFEAGRLGDAWHELAGHKSAAAEALRARVVARGRSDQTPIGERARVAVASGEGERARLWMRAQLGDTQDANLVLAAAEAAEELGDLERALGGYERALTLDPGSTAAALGRARSLALLGRAHDAAGILLGTLSDTTDPVALARLLELPGLDAASSARIHLRAAELFERRFDAEHAARHLARAAELDSSLEARVQSAAALLHASQGDGERARTAAERAAELGSGDAPVWEVLGEERRRAGDAPGARQAYERARELAPERVEPLAGLSELAVAEGDTETASSLLDRAVTLRPHAARTRVQLAGLLRMTGNLDAALGVLEGADVAAEPSATLLQEAARIRLERGDATGAVTLLEQAAELEPENAALHDERARAHEARGDEQAAAAARADAQRFAAASAAELASEDRSDADAAGSSAFASLSALAASYPAELPNRERAIEVVALLPLSRDTRAEGWRRFVRPRQLDLAEVGAGLAKVLGERYQVVSPDEIPHELERPDQEALRRLEGDSQSVARMSHALGTDAVFAARVADVEGGLHVELHMGIGGEDVEQVRRFRNEALVPGAAAQLSTWNPVALVMYSLLAILASLPLLRGWGELVVGIEYASLGKGFFSIKLSRRPARADQGSEGDKARREGRFLRSMSLMGRFQRHMVGRETPFRFLPARRYFVQVHGLLQDPATDDVVGNYFAEQAVTIQRGKSQRLDFDFRPKECALEVTVYRGGDPEAQAAVVLRGRPDSLRYTRQGRTLLYVAPGRYRVLVGLEDRVLEREIAIEGFTPRSLPFDAQDQSSALFVGCAEAVEPYLQGNLAAAADAIERAGDPIAAARVRGELAAEQGDVAGAARHFQQAGRFEEAAALVDGNLDPVSAARLYEQAGNREKAAEAWRQAGDLAAAAAHYEAAYRFEDALECYREAGHLEKVCELAEKLSQPLEAARVALELGDLDRAIRNLQGVEVRDVDYGAACQMLGQIFTERGETELAVQKLGEAVEVAGGADQAPLPLLEQYADALEQAGRLDAAIAAFESVRSRDFHRPRVAQRIEALRASVEAQKTVSVPAPGATKVTESRYELLQEIGRGGMGVVYKARDKRLGRVVALKRLPENLRNHPTAVRLFLREARAAAALNHRNIVTLYDADQEGDVYFLTMEFLEGLPLHEVVAKRGRLSPRDVARLAVQVASGLEFAHSRGVVHRDIKTSNLFFTRERVVKIMDFGLAKMVEEVRRAATVVGGTPYYMAPEQASGADVDHRADLYAFGVTLYEMLTGEVPFREGDLAHHHRHTPAPDPRVKIGDLPAELVELVLHLMAKRPEERPETTSQVVARLVEIAKRLAG